jgi:A/G-specific adenine glycosylase
MKKFSDALLSWYDLQGRQSLPWRLNISAYRVWVSEIMLQQTQVNTVIAYYQRFMACFPTLKSLALASQDEVLNLWTGLGYYARGRNLHKAAQKIVLEHGGRFPRTVEVLQDLPGIGRSTAGAISAIAFNQRSPILDGNVKRVLIRYYALAGEPKTLEKQLWTLADQHTPEERAGDYTQAIMDLGAMLCTRTKPLCALCPVKKGCQAYIKGKTHELPTPSTKKTTPVRAVKMLILHDTERNSVLLKRRPPVGVWGGLWSFPECSDTEDMEAWCQENYHLTIQQQEVWSTFKHVFTHFQLYITPVYVTAYESKKLIMMDDQDYVWYELKQVADRGFAAPVKRLLEALPFCPEPAKDL